MTYCPPTTGYSTKLWLFSVPSAGQAIAVLPIDHPWALPFWPIDRNGLLCGCGPSWCSLFLYGEIKISSKCFHITLIVPKDGTILPFITGSTLLVTVSTNWKCHPHWGTAHPYGTDVSECMRNYSIYLPWWLNVFGPWVPGVLHSLKLMYGSRCATSNAQVTQIMLA